MATSPVPVLKNVSAKEYWNLTKEAGAGNVTVTLHWEDAGFSDINDCSTTDLRVAHWDGSEWENNNNSVSTSGPGTCAGASAGYVSTTALVTSFTPFAFGSLSLAINPLPIELLTFNARSNEDVIDLSWITVAEINNDYFTLEKTIDGVNFVEVGIVEGAGNSTATLDYYFVDDNPYEGVSYYRLKQTDHDGEYSYSELKMVQNIKDNGDFTFNIYPNPNKGNTFNLEFTSFYGKEIIVVVYDLLGKKRYSTIIITSESNENVHAISPTNGLEAGVYFIIATSNNQIYKKRLIVY